MKELKDLIEEEEKRVEAWRKRLQEDIERKEKELKDFREWKPPVDG